jgi:hypothetical protein
MKTKIKNIKIKNILKRANIIQKLLKCKMLKKPNRSSRTCYNCWNESLLITSDKGQATYYICPICGYECFDYCE